MPFCSNCGNQANKDEKFCTECGSPIVIKQISISHNVGEIIKEEYELGQAPPQSDQTGGSHIGDQKRSGEWLESTVENILKFAGFETQREKSFVFNENTGDRFRVDIVARDSEIEIFVECKDYSTTKMDEKIKEKIATVKIRSSSRKETLLILEKLGLLRKTGVITEKEFQKKKRELLKGI